MSRERVANRRFEITTRVTLRDTPGPARLWLSLAQTAGGYQTALGLRWEGTGQHEIARDAVHGAAMSRSSWNGDTMPRRIEVVQTVATRDRDSLPLLPLNEAKRRFWNAPTPSAPTGEGRRAIGDQHMRLMDEDHEAGEPKPLASGKVISRSYDTGGR